MSAPLTLAQIQADPQAVIRHHLRQDPKLWWGGMFSWHYARRIAPERGQTAEEMLAGHRRETLEPEGVEQLLRAAEFIAQAPRTQSLNRKRGTYGWKHVAERWHRQQGRSAYVGEGAFIIAARAIGLTVWRDQHGFHFVNLSSRAVPKEGRDA